jgi:uncharacterized protein YdaU (DUF1376 family)
MNHPPLLASDVDLRDFPFMLLDVRTLLSSDTWIEASEDPRLGHALMSLWCESWHQVPAGSLPSSDKVLCRLSMCNSSKEWERIRERVLSCFVLCTDGRYYHPVVCEKALEAWVKRTTSSRRGKAGANARWKREQSSSNGTSNGTSMEQVSNEQSSCTVLPLLADSKGEGKGEIPSQERDIQGLQGDPPPRMRAHVSAREAATPPQTGVDPLSGVAHG